MCPFKIRTFNQNYYNYVWILRFLEAPNLIVYHETLAERETLWNEQLSVRSMTCASH